MKLTKRLMRSLGTQSIRTRISVSRRPADQENANKFDRDGGTLTADENVSQRIRNRSGLAVAERIAIKPNTDK